MKITAENFNEIMEVNLWGHYRKVTLTRAFGPFKVVEDITISSRKGDHDLPIGWQGYIVEDESGDKYPIDEHDFSVAYTRYLVNG